MRRRSSNIKLNPITDCVPPIYRGGNLILSHFDEELVNTVPASPSASPTSLSSVKYVDGVFDKAVYFNGYLHYNMYQTSDKLLDVGFAIDFWFYGVANAYASILINDISVIVIRQQASNLTLSIGNWGVAASARPAGKWYHMIAKYDNINKIGSVQIGANIDKFTGRGTEENLILSVDLDEPITQISFRNNYNREFYIDEFYVTEFGREVLEPPCEPYRTS